jgi:hypothetical protein
MRCPYALDSGTYVLGSLTPAERDAYERHLPDCATCRDEVADLAVLPGLLGRLDGDTVAELVGGGRVAAPVRAPETLLPDMLWAAHAQRVAQRRRGRWRTVGAGLVAAFVAVIAGLGVDLVINRGDSPPVPMYAMHPVVNDPVPVTADVALIPTDQGTLIRIHCAYQVDDQDHHRWTFRLYVVPRAGDAEQVGTWTAKYGDDFWVNQSTRLAPSEIARLELRRGDGTTLLAYEPA